VNVISAQMLVDNVLFARTTTVYPATDALAVPETAPAAETSIHVVPDVFEYEPALVATLVNENVLPAPTLPIEAAVVHTGRVATTSVKARFAKTSVDEVLMARIENVNVPDPVGVPLNTPVDVASANPTGKVDPETSAYDPAFVALSVSDVIASFLAVSASLAAVDHAGRLATIIVNARSANTVIELGLVARTVNVNVPDAVGVPDNTPVEEANDTPAGSDDPGARE
jgi:hypothetical protein